MLCQKLEDLIIIEIAQKDMTNNCANLFTHLYSKSIEVKTNAIFCAEWQITTANTNKNTKILYFPKLPICIKTESRELSKFDSLILLSNKTNVRVSEFNEPFYTILYIFGCIWILLFKSLINEMISYFIYQCWIFSIPWLSIFWKPHVVVILMLLINASDWHQTEKCILQILQPFKVAKNITQYWD